MLLGQKQPDKIDHKVLVAGASWAGMYGEGGVGFLFDVSECFLVPVTILRLPLATCPVVFGAPYVYDIPYDVQNSCMPQMNMPVVQVPRLRIVKVNVSSNLDYGLDCAHVDWTVDYIVNA